MMQRNSSTFCYSHCNCGIQNIQKHCINTNYYTINGIVLEKAVNPGKRNYELYQRRRYQRRNDGGGGI